MPPLRRADLDPDPAVQFEDWLELARAEVPLPEAMTLATVDADGRPDARMVLLKGVDAAGFRFHSHERSAKGRQIDARPDAAVVVYWRELDRQVRVRGRAEKLPAEESDAYFATRSRDSQLGAWASPQSEVIADRAELDVRVAKIGTEHRGEEIPRPPHWGGYIVVPAEVEFWQGQVGRLHDRFRYRRDDDGAWIIERLAP